MNSWMYIQITLRSPEEYLIQLKGTFDVVNGTEAVTSLTFITNQRICGPYGSTSGQAFESTPGKIVGFCGRSESLLHQIGVITELSSEVQLRKSFGTTIVVTKSGTDIQENILLSGDGGPEQKGQIVQGTSPPQKVEHWYRGIDGGSQQSTREVVVRPRDEGLKVHGPWGGSGGTVFSDGRGEIVEILVTFDSKQVISVQVSYAHGESKFKGSIHGGVDASGGKTEKVIKKKKTITVII